MTAAAGGSNDLAAKAITYITRIEEIDDELDFEKGTYMATCRTLRSKRKDVFGDAKSAGIAVKPLKAVVKRRKLESKIAGLPVDFDIHETAQYSALASAFAGTPFGQFAQARAQASNGGDLRPDPEPRADEEYLAKFGRGPDPVDGLADPAA